MSTRALYTFKDQHNEYNVYKHHDGYPMGAAETLQNALKYAWEPSRFEADEFACAFIAAGKVSVLESKQSFNKSIGEKTLFSGGGVRLMPQGPAQAVAEKNCVDIEYRYAIYQESGKLVVAAFEILHIPFDNQDKRLYDEKWLFTTSIETMLDVAKAIEKAELEAQATS